MTQPNRLLVSFSGGRTSAYMANWIRHNLSHKYDEVLYIFANTGQEREETLTFVDQCDSFFGLNLVWVEALVHQGERKGTGHTVVTHATADRSGRVFEDHIIKYGIPNKAFPHCTRELKLRPITSYVRSIGWKAGTYDTALGIRVDEIDRMSDTAKEKRLIYPLVNLEMTKQDVIRWWREMPFDLELKEHQGNCAWCWKKSDRKLCTLIKESPEIFDFPRRMEEKYGMESRKKEHGHKVTFFRNNKSVDDLFAQAQQPFKLFVEGEVPTTEQLEFDLSNGCSESCEVNF